MQPRNLCELSERLPRGSVEQLRRDHRLHERLPDRTSLHRRQRHVRRPSGLSRRRSARRKLRNDRQSWKHDAHRKLRLVQQRLQLHDEHLRMHIHRRLRRRVLPGVHQRLRRHDLLRARIGRDDVRQFLRRHENQQLRPDRDLPFDMLVRASVRTDLTHV